jgi:DNA polymerase III subunit delta'
MRRSGASCCRPRPVPFDSVLGHERIRGLLARALDGGRVPHAMLLAGPEGVGKKSLAIALGRALLCAAPSAGPCERCATCLRTRRSLDALDASRETAIEENKKEDDALRFNFRLHPDLVVVEQPWKRRDDGTLRPQGVLIHQIRDLVSEVRRAPFEASHRLYVIDDAHTMNDASANTLLKSLEEPPSHTHFALVTHSPQGLLRTIRSRCQQFRLGPLPMAVIETRLLETQGVTPAVAHLQAAMADGSLRSAFEFQSETWERRRETMLSLLEAAAGGLPVLHRVEAADALREADDDEKALAIRALRSLLRDVAALRQGAEPGQVLNADVGERLLRLARTRVGQSAIVIAEAAAETSKALAGNANALLAFDLLMDAVAC